MKIKSISFGDIPFRMFRNLTINISERLTVIAGHNGIGKSTLLGLIANGSELKSSEGKTLLKRSFQAQLHELFYLDIAKDYVKKVADKPSFTLTYSQPGKKDLIKTCNVSKHSDKKLGTIRLKVVPRGVQEGWNVGASAKVPIPTLFLSMSRMLPNGEYQSSLNSELSKTLSEEDKIYIREKFKAIIDNKVIDSDHITKQELKGTTKRSLLPEFEHSTRTISLGQDSFTGNMNKIDRRTKSCVITGVVCGIGELAGIFCIARYRTHRNEYDPPFYFTPALNEESIGFSFMKNF